MNLRDSFYIFLIGLKRKQTKHQNILTADFPSMEREDKLGEGKAKIGCTDVHSLPDAPFPSHGSGYTWGFVLMRLEIIMFFNTL